jgi:hypothetical protein
MAKKQPNLGGFEQVKGRIQNVVTTEIFVAEFDFALHADLKEANQKYGWSFNWLDFKGAFHIAKITTANNEDVLQGLVAFTKKDNHLFMDFVEVAPHNKGKGKVYDYVAGNLLAFVCYVSKVNGFEGYVLFEPKPQLNDLYLNNYGAVYFPKSNNKMMYFSDIVANSLINRYLIT